DRAARGRARDDLDHAQRGDFDRHGRAAAAPRTRNRAYRAHGNPARRVRAPDRAAAGAVRNVGPASRQWLPDAAPEKRGGRMTPHQQQVRMADAATAPAQPAATSGTAPLEGVPAIPDDALILITTRNLVL